LFLKEVSYAHQSNIKEYYYLYLDLTAECREAGWSAVSYPVEVGCRGFVGTSTQRFLKSMGVTGPKLRNAMKVLAEEAEQGSFWLWLRRKDQAWGKQGS